LDASDWRAAHGELISRWSEIADLASATALLHWDQETYMPRGGIEGRAAVLSSLAGVIHSKLTAPELADLLATLGDSRAAAEMDDDERTTVALAQRDVTRATRLEPALVRELAAATSLAQAAWAKARDESSFEAFAPHLARVFELKRRAADQIGFEGSPLDAFLDDYEPGTTVAQLETLFDGLVAELAPLVARYGDPARRHDVSPLRRSLPESAQREFAVAVATAFGFDFDRGRLDRSAHPFCQGVHDGDVRITFRAAGEDLRPALYGVIHEAGHGLYEQGLPAAFRRTPIGDAASLGIHESQSRLWENMVGRSESFWRCFLPRLQALAPGRFDDVDVRAAHRAANEVRPSLIRVEADELTYNLHVALRFRIERDLFAGRLEVRDLPAAWNDAMEHFLGIRPTDDREGCLQDIHWSMGAFGYFPTYTLGNLYAAQLLAAARREIGDLDAAFAAGEFRPLLDWLRRNVHAIGRRHKPTELITAATGAPPSARPFLDYLREKHERLAAD
jgi:carboxypeptidase Taq